MCFGFGKRTLPGFEIETSRPSIFRVSRSEREALDDFVDRPLVRHRRAHQGELAHGPFDPGERRQFARRRRRAEPASRARRKPAFLEDVLPRSSCTRCSASTSASSPAGVSRGPAQTILLCFQYCPLDRERMRAGLCAARGRDRLFGCHRAQKGERQVDLGRGG